MTYILHEAETDISPIISFQIYGN